VAQAPECPRALGEFWVLGTPSDPLDWALGASPSAHNHSEHTFTTPLVYMSYRGLMGIGTLQGCQLQKGFSNLAATAALTRREV
jgi:hypothetical protein